MMCLIKQASRMELKKQKQRDMVVSAARSMIKEEGFFFLNMNTLARQVDVSVGAVYLMFRCKEELLCHIALDGLKVLQGFMTKALTLDVSSREKMVAVHLVHTYFAENYPVEYQAIYSSKMDGIAQKIPPHLHKELNAGLQSIFKMIADMIDTAASEKDLSLPVGINAEELVYSIWSLHYGNLALAGFDMQADGKTLARETVHKAFFRALLDSVLWVPLSKFYNYDEARVRLVKLLDLK